MIFPAPIRNLKTGFFQKWNHFDAWPNFPWITTLIVAVAVAISLIPGAAEGLIYDRASIQQGESWRLITGQLVHAHAVHLLLSINAFFAWGSVCEAWHRRIYPYFLTTMALLTGGVLYFQQPALMTWCGLSGLCTATFVWAAGIVYKVGRRRKLPALSWAALIAVFCVIAKVVIESLTGAALLPTVFAGGYFTPPFVNTFGALLGGAAYFVSREEKAPKRRRRTQRVMAKGSRSMSILSRT